MPKRIDSHLWLYDCISCDKCVPVCPNDANFYYELEPFEIEFTNYTWSDGKLQPADTGKLKVEKKHQIANFADWCNECGNCDTFCPEYGGPFIQKPSFFASREAWLDNAQRDGFYITRNNGQSEIVGRIEGKLGPRTFERLDKARHAGDDEQERDRRTAHDQWNRQLVVHQILEDEDRRGDQRRDRKQRTSR